MVDLSDILPQDSQTVTAIYDHWKKTGDSKSRRTYLGASEIGYGCQRHLWYSFRWCKRKRFDGRMYRLFDRGDMEEYRFANDLRAIGCEVHEVNSETGEQFEVKACGGHFSGHMDGCALNIPEAPKTWHVLEFKTHNAKSFAYLKAHKVQAAKPAHYDQMMVYMHLTGMTRALYMACNKDTDELHSERIEHDRQYSEKLLFRAQQVIDACQPPAGNENMCRFCQFNSLCKGTSQVALDCEINCRTCVHAVPEMDGDGRWSCSLKQKTLSTNDQRAACDWHCVAPGLITFAHVKEVGRNADGSTFIEYSNNNVVWRNGPCKADGQYLSKELTMLKKSDVGCGIVDQMKKTFEGEVVK